MAPLSPVYWEAVTPELRELLRFIGQCAFVERFYLADGTALALSLGYRRSIDGILVVGARFRSVKKG